MKLWFLFEFLPLMIFDLHPTLLRYPLLSLFIVVCVFVYVLRTQKLLIFTLKE